MATMIEQEQRERCPAFDDEGSGERCEQYAGHTGMHSIVYPEGGGTQWAASAVPRRVDMTRWTEAERKIDHALQEVERMGADVRLTNAVIALEDARSWVADFVDGVAVEHHYPRRATPSEATP